MTPHALLDIASIGYIRAYVWIKSAIRVEQLGHDCMIATIAAYIAITENMLIQKLGLTLCCLFLMCSAAHQLTPCPKDTPSPVISSTFESTVSFDCE